MTNRLDEFQAYRARMNERILAVDHLGIRRFFNLDAAAYKAGALDGKTKEMLGLVASMVLRCNDCIDYHVLQCVDAGCSDEELQAGELARNALGLPLVWAGGFADVYRVHCPATGNTWAVKCFAKETPQLRERYRHRVGIHGPPDGR